MASRRRRRVVVVGAGITGLVATWELSRDHEVTLLEAGPRAGGHVQTEAHPDGYVIDGGADSFLVSKPHALALARELGLGDRLIPTRQEARRVYLYSRGALRAMPQ